MGRREAIAWAVGLIGLLAAVASPGLRAEAQMTTTERFVALERRVLNLELNALPPKTAPPPLLPVPAPLDPANTFVLDCQFYVAGSEPIARSLSRSILGCVRYTGFPTMP